MARFQCILATVLLWYLTHLQINLLGWVIRGWQANSDEAVRAWIGETMREVVLYAQATAALLIVGLAGIGWCYRKAAVEKFMRACMVLQCLVLVSGALVFYNYTYPAFIMWERAYRALIEQHLKTAPPAVPSGSDVK